MTGATEHRFEFVENVVQFAVKLHLDRGVGVIDSALALGHRVGQPLYPRHSVAPGTTRTTAVRGSVPAISQIADLLCSRPSEYDAVFPVGVFRGRTRRAQEVSWLVSISALRVGVTRTERTPCDCLDVRISMMPNDPVWPDVRSSFGREPRARP